MRHVDGRGRGRALRAAALAALLAVGLTLLCFSNREVRGQYGQPCETCEENKYKCEVQAEWDYQQCRREHTNNPDECDPPYQATLQRCADEYTECAASCNAATGDPNHPFPTGCTDAGTGALVNVEPNGYITGWAMDGDAQSYNQCIRVEFSVDRPSDLWNPADFGACAILRLPPGAGHGYAVVMPARYRDGQAHTLYVRGRRPRRDGGPFEPLRARNNSYFTDKIF